jgi:hypothetical protein
MIRSLKGLVSFAQFKPIPNVFQKSSLIHQFSVKNNNTTSEIKKNEYAPYLSKKNPSTKTSESAQ